MHTCWRAISEEADVDVARAHQIVVDGRYLILKLALYDFNTEERNKKKISKRAQGDIHIKMLIVKWQ